MSQSPAYDEGHERRTRVICVSRVKLARKPYCGSFETGFG